jgi:hypothetical protein
MFRTREYDPAVLTHVDADAAQRRAAEVVEWAKKNFSDRKYADAHRRLTVQWLPKWTFDAHAARYSGDPAHDIIGISSGVPIALHDDAETFLRWVEKEISHSSYDEIYENIGILKMRGLPPGLDRVAAVDRMFRMTMAWLYLHEQAHLFQRHADLPKIATSQGLIEEFFGHDGDSRCGHEAAVRHACELSADHEATVLALQLMLLADDQEVRPVTLWLFFAGLACMFQRFYGSGERWIMDEAIGTHPPPSYRVWLTRKLMIDFIMHPKVIGRAKGLRGIVHLNAVLDHAVVTAAMYWNARYNTGQPVDDFLNGAAGLKAVNFGYQKHIFETWRVLRPRVVDMHFGWGTDSVLELTAPDVLASARQKTQAPSEASGTSGADG